jgi:CheY-like chemotaxis protein
MDPSQLQQIIMNLVINAGEAIGEGNPGRVTVVTGTKLVKTPFFDASGQEISPGRYVCMEVGDTGCGIEPEYKDKIFDPFFTTKFIGRGLGLAAVAGIVRSEKGAIVVESAPGKGSIFRVLLPAAAGHHDLASDTGTADFLATILVVDDEKSVRESTGDVLKRRSYRVLTAADGDEALALCGCNDGINAAIVDIVMPGIGAKELLPALKARQPGIRILLTSGYNEAEVRRLCTEYPNSLFIQKPYTPHQISNAVRDLLAGPEEMSSQYLRPSRLSIARVGAST